MDVLRQVKIPFCRGTDRKPKRSFCEVAQVIGRSAILFSLENVVTTGKRVGAELYEIAVLKFFEVVNSRNKLHGCEVCGKADFEQLSGLW